MSFALAKLACASASFARACAEAGVGTFIIHARKAMLEGLSPKQNRDVPPLDYALVLAALRRPPVAFVGVIGSATKRARFLSRLERDGVDEGARARLTCPIGVGVEA